MSDGSSDADQQNHQRGPQAGERELDTKMLEVQRKRFYVDVKQNQRGRFIKLAEVGLGGRKSRIILSMSAAVAFRNHLDKFVKFFDGLASGEKPTTTREDGQLRSEVILFRTRRYFLDLKENSRGRYLRVSQMIPRGVLGVRSQIALPAPGMALLRDTLTEFIDKYSEGYLNESSDNGNLNDVKHIWAENNKIFYFDAGSNDRGTYLRVSEVKQVSGQRSTLTIPRSAWEAFRDMMNEYIEKAEAKEEDEGAALETPAAAGEPAANNAEANE